MRVARNPEELALEGPALVDRFLEGALELDVDVLCDGEDGWVAAILEHVERAGVHSGDSAVVLPAPSVAARWRRRSASRDDARRGLGARGLLNLQLALHEGDLYVLEANPRASRTVPFVAKATGIPLVDHACRLLLGERSPSSTCPSGSVPARAWAKEAIFPSDRFAGAADRGAGDAVDRRGDGERRDARRGLPPRPPGGRKGTGDRRDRSTVAGERVSSTAMAADPLVRKRRSCTACRCRSSRRRVTTARRR